MRVRSLEELSRTENVEFDQLLKEAEERSNGDPSLVTRILGRLLSVRLGTEKRSQEQRGKMQQEEEQASTKPRYDPSPSSSKNINNNNISKIVKQKKEKPRKPKMEKLKEHLPKEPPEDVMAFIRDRQGTGPVLVIDKFVETSDLSSHLLRFSMPIKKVTKDEGFLNEEERSNLNNYKGYRLKVRLVEPKFLDVSEMELTQWCTNSYIYALAGRWGTVLKKYREDERYKGVLKEEDIVQIWAFRCNEGKDLWLAMVVVNVPPEVLELCMV